MLTEGRGRDEILDFYVAEYGERILSMPRAQGFNLTAYVLPGLFLLLGAWITVVLIRKWHRPKQLAVPEKPHLVVERGYVDRVERDLWEGEERGPSKCGHPEFYF